ncbi:MAG: hypothetical protein IJF78_03000 [Clostridia bacterium]|nr:hypothetical protein [Clostridia bacterium]
MFNRITLRYTASAPTKGVIAYDTDGGTVRDTFWLESGVNAGFSLLIQGALDGRTADNCRLLSLNAADGTSSAAEIHEIGTDTAVLPGEPWIEKDGVRLGITLEMGGAIASLTDSRSPDGYTNLLNRFDPGRLVQQSYYGIAEPPYEPGEFMGNPWAYNPVQGGDKGGNRSRIIAYSRTEDEICIKAQPYDWGHVGRITPSYMENRYRFLDNGVICVENRFTDFSGYNHPPKHQELPALYVVSALDIFTWEDAGVRRSRDDLIFWPLASDQHFLLTEPDTAFSVWHDRSGYGVGLAAPGTEMFYAGRHEHNGSADPYDNGTNYTAPLKVVHLRSFKPLSYRYLLAVGDIESIAARFRETLPEIDNSSLTQYGG